MNISFKIFYDSCRKSCRCEKRHGAFWFVLTEFRNKKLIYLSGCRILTGVLFFKYFSALRHFIEYIFAIEISTAAGSQFLVGKPLNSILNRIIETILADFNEGSNCFQLTKEFNLKEKIADWSHNLCSNIFSRGNKANRNLWSPQVCSLFLFLFRLTFYGRQTVPSDKFFWKYNYKFCDSNSRPFTYKLSIPTS